MVDMKVEESNMHEDPEAAGCKGCVECGLIMDRADRMHAHENDDGVCWHEDGE